MVQSAKIPERVLIIGGGVFGATLLLELLQRYPQSHFIAVAPSIPERLAPKDVSSYHTADAAAPRIASNDVNRIIRPDYADPDYARLMGLTSPKWRNTPGLSSHYFQSGLLLTAEKDTTAEKYIGKSLENVRSQGRRVREFVGQSGMEAAMRSPIARATGHCGYLNEESGWANAGGALGWVWDQIADLSRSRNVSFHSRPVEQLLFSRDHKMMRGVSLEGGERIDADLTVLATGAWTPALLDLTGIASARGQSLGYVDLTEEEASKLHDVPVHFNMSSGCFFFPPTKKEIGGWEIKVARHGFGYCNPSTSVPSFPDRLPDADRELMLGFLQTCLPSVDLRERQFRARLCWYLDTADSNFIASFHPEFGRSLFVATGGSGHAFKFLPIMGEHLADVLDGSDESKSNGRWTQKWKWPEILRDSGGKVIPEIWCHDGSRAGVPGVTLDQALNGDRRAVEMPRSRL